MTAKYAPYNEPPTRPRAPPVDLPTSPQQAPFPKVEWGDHAAKLRDYGEGPWVDEPDRVEWRSQGLPCLVRRVEGVGHFCGYVGVTEGHPLYGKDADEVRGMRVHGGVTATHACDERGACHVPEPGEPHEVWWIGFDCGHGGHDVMPFMLSPRHPMAIKQDDPMFKGCEYRTVQYAITNVELLALQVAGARGGDLP